MEQKRISPHDRYVRSMLSNPRVVNEFFEATLPEHIKKHIDLSSLELQKDSFIDDKLRVQITDLLYKATFDGEPGYICLLSTNLHLESSCHGGY